MSENPTHADRARHIDTRLYFLRDMVRDGVVKLIKIPGTENVADGLTKSRPPCSGCSGFVQDHAPHVGDALSGGGEYEPLIWFHLGGACHCPWGSHWGECHSFLPGGDSSETDSPQHLWKVKRAPH
eukprot:1567241-Rhodomonas_salina.2